MNIDENFCCGHVLNSNICRKLWNTSLLLNPPKMGAGMKTHYRDPSTHRPTWIHTLQLNFLFSDWLFTCSKYWKCQQHSVYCAQTARGAFGAWLCAWTSHWLIHFFHWVKLLIFFMFSDILRPFYLEFFMNMSNWFLFFCHVWIRLINLHLLLLGKCDKSMHLLEFDACPMYSTLRASGIGCITSLCVCIGFVSFHLKK